MNAVLPDIIVTDLDGTLVNIMDEVCAKLWQQFAIACTPEDCRQYNVAAALWSTVPAVRDVFRNTESFARYLVRTHWKNPCLYSAAKPYWDWHQVLQIAQARDVAILLLTSREENADIIEATVTWCDEWGYANAPTAYSGSRGGKAAVMAALQKKYRKAAIWHVDDDFDVFHAVRRNARSVCTLVPCRPWTISNVTNTNPVHHLRRLLKGN